MKRLGVSLAILAAAAVATASALAATAADPHAEKERLTAADMALARSASLRLGDLGAGWRRTPATPDDNTSFSCPGYNPDFSRFTITGKAETAFAQAGQQINAAVYVFATRAQAVGDFRLTASPGLLRCVRESLARELARDPSGMRITLSARMMPAPRVGEQSFALRVVARLSASGQSVPVYLDLVAFRRGRSIAAVMFTAALQPVTRQLAATRAVAARMR